MAHSAAHEASLRFTSPTDRGGYAIAALSGDLGTASAPALREQLRSLLRAASQLIIDLSAVEHADAGGLAVLVGSGHRARLLGGSLRLAAPSPDVARVLSASGIGPVVVVYPRSAGDGGQRSCTQSASPVRRASCSGSIVRPQALQFCLGVGEVIFNRQPVTFVAAGCASGLVCDAIEPC